MLNIAEYLVEQLNSMSEFGLDIEEEFAENLVYKWIEFVAEALQRNDEEIADMLRESVSPNCVTLSSIVNSIANDLDQ